MAVPERVLTNRDMETIVDTSDDWIQKRTGIRERRIAGPHDTTTTLAVRAARQALEVADVLPHRLNLIIVATSTPNYIFPGTANQVQDQIGAVRAGAFDLSAACTGFVYALDMASQAIRSGSIDMALVIGAETMSRVLDWSDRSTCILFGDGAGAVVLRGSRKPGGIEKSLLRSDGSGSDLLTVPSVGSDWPNGKGPESQPPPLSRMYMNGREVFRFATVVMQDAIREVAEKSGVALEDIDLIIPHQANQRIIDSAARSLKIPVERFYSNIARYGNTSAASIPIALCEAIQEDVVRPGQNIILTGFGAGLSWGAISLRWTLLEPTEPPIMRRQRRQFMYAFARVRSFLLRTWRWIESWFRDAPTSEAPVRRFLRGNRPQQAESEESESDDEA
jgi:3-oxoacyl-[acyl-carrier-protein] synthase-3